MSECGLQSLCPEAFAVDSGWEISDSVVHAHVLFWKSSHFDCTRLSLISYLLIHCKLAAGAAIVLRTVLFVLRAR
jgi:hypothetical protein